MRIFQLETAYRPFLDALYRDLPGLANQDYQTQLLHLLRSGFSAGHMLTPYLPRLGHECFTCIANCAALQQAWLRENIPAAKQQQDFSFAQVALMQVEAFRPDIFYATDPTFFDTTLLNELAKQPRLCVGWRAAPTSETVDFSGFNLMLTSDPNFRAICEERGARRVEYFYPGHPIWINELLGPRELNYDLVFSGQIGYLHQRRSQILETVLPVLKDHGLNIGLFALGEFTDNPSLNAMNQGPRFGLEMYRVLHQSRMTLNIVIDVASHGGINMRHFEATGVGSVVIDCGATENQIFDNGTECFCFKNIDETIDRILWLKETPGSLQSIGENGKRKCLTDYEMAVRAERFIAICDDFHHGNRPVQSFKLEPRAES